MLEAPFCICYGSIAQHSSHFNVQQARNLDNVGLQAIVEKKSICSLCSPSDRFIIQSVGERHANFLARGVWRGNEFQRVLANGRSDGGRRDAVPILISRMY